MIDMVNFKKSKFENEVNNNNNDKTKILNNDKKKIISTMQSRIHIHNTDIERERSIKHVIFFCEEDCLWCAEAPDLGKKDWLSVCVRNSVVFYHYFISFFVVFE